MPRRRKTNIIQLLFISLSLFSCSTSIKNNYVGFSSNEKLINSVPFYYTNSFVLTLQRGIATLSISSFSFEDSKVSQNPTGKRFISRVGSYSVSSTQTSGSLVQTTLDLPLADSVLIEQKGEGFDEISSSTKKDFLYINTDDWDSTTVTNEFETPLQIRECFGHPATVVVQSSPDKKPTDDFEIVGLPPIFFSQQ